MGHSKDGTIWHGPSGKKHSNCPQLNEINFKTNEGKSLILDEHSVFLINSTKLTVFVYDLY